VEFRILGPLEVVNHGQPLPLGRGRQRALLALLLLHANRTISSDLLIDALWGEKPPPTAIAVLQNYVAKLRRTLGPDALVTRAGGYLLRVDPEDVDAARFERLVGDRRFHDALALWRGPALADFAYEQFAHAETSRLEELRLNALEERIDADLASGRHGEVVAELEALVREHPLRERFRAQLMLALYRSGRQADALEACRDARRALVEELGIEPTAALKHLETAILRQDSSLDAPSGRPLPTGTVTLLFTDIEGSTRLLQAVGDGYRELLEEHAAQLRHAFATHRGHEIDMQGDAFLVAFSEAKEAVRAAIDAQRALAAHSWPQGTDMRVRIGIHTGVPIVADRRYVGLDVHRGARICEAGHGGQILLAQTTADLVSDGFALRDLGEHRLKDLIEPVRLFQVLAEGLPREFPALRTLENRPTNLPAQPTPLVGRERELGELSVLLRHDDVRLVTLTGPGGSGKTRLALQLAAQLLERFSSGVFFVALAPISEPELVVPTIAQTLGLRELPGQTLPETLMEYLRERDLLLLLDNFEQVLDAAAAAAELLTGALKLKLLVTSRAPLHVAGEREYPVQPLRQDEAVALFVERAQEVQEDFALTDDNGVTVEEICERVDRLPLAIELAAARVRVLSPQALLARLDQRLKLLTGGPRDVPARQQTLRATIAWSHDLLSEEQRALFARLSVFAGGCTLEAAETVCGADLDELTVLVERSLVRADRSSEHPRFTMLETIREYAAERLEETGQAGELRRRHTEYFLSIAERAQTELAGPEQATWFERLEMEHDNLRAALDWSLDTGERDTGLRVATAIGRFWEVRGHLSDGRRWLERLLRLAADAPPHLRAKALRIAGRLAERQQDEAARALLSESLDAAREAGDERGVAESLRYIGEERFWRGNFPEARWCFDESLEISRRTGDLWGTADSLLYLAFAGLVEWEFERAQSLFEQALDLGRKLGDKRVVGRSVAALGSIRYCRGEYAAARPLAEEGLSLARDLGHKEDIAGLLGFLASLALELGDDAAARSLMEEAAATASEIGARWLDATRCRFLGIVARNEGEYPAAQALFEQALASDRALGERARTSIPTTVTVLGDLARRQGNHERAAALLAEGAVRWKDVRNKLGMAECLEASASLAGVEGDTERAAQLFGAAQALREEIGMPIRPSDRAEYERSVALVRDLLDEAAFAAPWAEGRSMTVDDALALAVRRPVSASTARRSDPRRSASSPAGERERAK
jgi:predicted ATPase/DNA-binding SARP family transcriptional activator